MCVFKLCYASPSLLLIVFFNLHFSFLPFDSVQSIDGSVERVWFVLAAHTRCACNRKRDLHVYTFYLSQFQHMFMWSRSVCSAKFFVQINLDVFFVDSSLFSLCVNVFCFISCLEPLPFFSDHMSIRACMHSFHFQFRSEITNEK